MPALTVVLMNQCYNFITYKCSVHYYIYCICGFLPPTVRKCCRTCTGTELVKMVYIAVVIQGCPWQKLNTGGPYKPLIGNAKHIGKSHPIQSLTKHCQNNVYAL